MLHIEEGGKYKEKKTAIILGLNEANINHDFPGRPS